MIRDGGTPRDAGEGARDSGATVRDGGPFVRDGGPFVRDAGPPPRDGGPSVRDGGPFVRDAGNPPPIDGGPFPDSGVHDAGPAPRDGGPIRDGSVPRDGGGIPFPDGGIPFPDGGIPFPDGGTNGCVFPDTYTTNFFGTTLYFDFSVAGTWGAGITVVEAQTNPTVSGTYNYVEPIIAINDGVAGSGCPPQDTGFYLLQYTPACDVLTVTLVTDPCASRAMTLNGSTFARVP